MNENNDLKKMTLYQKLIDLLERVVFNNPVEKMLGCLPKTADLKKTFENIFKEMDIELIYRPEDLANIPQKGPIIVVANHPFGVLDGVAMSYLLLNVRQDVKLLANAAVKKNRPLSPLIIGISVFDAKNTSATTLRGLQEAQEWLEKGGALGIFPSGTVSHWHTKQWKVTDPEWQQACVRLAILNNATIVRMYFHGGNRWYFHLAGMISSYFRSLLLSQQFYAKRHSQLKVTIGSPIYPSELKQQGNTKNQLHYLRNQTYLLKHRAHQPETLTLHTESNETIEPPIQSERLEDELRHLDSSAILLQHGDYQVYFANGKDIPNTIQEIGRLREITFRQAGEGTGKSNDLDRFDSYYSHLFIWHAKEKKIVGAYRLGLTEQILPVHGNEGMYISTLYHSTNDFLSRIHPAIELGRSFIISDHQKKFAILSLMWKGVGRMLVKMPQYTHLYGVVSVSHHYQKLSRDLIVHMLQNGYSDRELASIMQPKHPYDMKMKLPKRIQEQIVNFQNLDQLDSLVSELEYDRKGLPILIKQYHNLQAKFINFSIDKMFQECLDCLIVVKVKDIPTKLLTYYMEKEGIESYHLYHSKRQEP